ncbi:hypothetical protein FNV43_RR05824 [Rhamnella rubrinervis]|uniref:Uncharacterized protein n=1 Tax=Rhamnella rubrinervis TaxID=2594499 RepID=A0A8K0HNQ7_9ROSA|nr:hypothetical protein FNV43_RR05824 [Rhamnella rubrinervis]
MGLDAVGPFHFLCSLEKRFITVARDYLISGWPEAYSQLRTRMWFDLCGRISYLGLAASFSDEDGFRFIASVTSRVLYGVEDHHAEVAGRVARMLWARPRLMATGETQFALTYGAGGVRLKWPFGDRVAQAVGIKMMAEATMLDNLENLRNKLYHGWRSEHGKRARHGKVTGAGHTRTGDLHAQSRAMLVCQAGASVHLANTFVSKWHDAFAFSKSFNFCAVLAFLHWINKCYKVKKCGYKFMDGLSISVEMQNHDFLHIGIWLQVYVWRASIASIKESACREELPSWTEWVFYFGQHVGLRLVGGISLVSPCVTILAWLGVGQSLAMTLLFLKASTLPRPRRGTPFVWAKRIASGDDKLWRINVAGMAECLGYTLAPLLRLHGGCPRGALLRILLSWPVIKQSTIGAIEPELKGYLSKADPSIADSALSPSIGADSAAFSESSWPGVDEQEEAMIAFTVLHFGGVEDLRRLTVDGRSKVKRRERGASQVGPRWKVGQEYLGQGEDGQIFGRLSGQIQPVGIRVADRLRLVGML